MKPKSILGKTLYDHRLATFFWCIGLFLTLIMYISLYPSVSHTDDFAKAMASLPESFQTIFGDLSIINTPEGYLQAELFSSVLPLIFVILAISLGSNLIHREEASGTLELLLVRPISRTRIIIEKLVALIIIMILVCLSALVGLLVGQLYVDFPISLANFTSAVFSSLAIGLFFGMISFAITAAKPLKGLAIGLPAALFLLSFIVTGFADSVEFFEAIKYISPFQYYQSIDILREGMRWLDLVILSFSSLFLIFYSLLVFRRRDVGV